jgi:hypothetical protein
MCFFCNSAEYTYLQHTELVSTLKHLCCGYDTFQKLSQLTQGNTVLGDPASNRDGVLTRDTLVFQHRRIGLFGTK